MAVDDACFESLLVEAEAENEILRERVRELEAMASEVEAMVARTRSDSAKIQALENELHLLRGGHQGIVWPESTTKHTAPPSWYLDFKTPLSEQKERDRFFEEQRILLEQLGVEKARMEKASVKKRKVRRS